MKYKKKPVDVDAFLLTAENVCKPESWPEWLREAYSRPKRKSGSVWYEGDNSFLFVGTLEGRYIIHPPYYIIMGVAGEIYPCEPDIFSKTYEQSNRGPISDIFTKKYHIDLEFDQNEVRGTIENWNLVYNFEGRFIITGKMFNSDAFQDGAEVSTSTVRQIDVENGYVRTKNSVYKLGKHMTGA